MVALCPICKQPTEGVEDRWRPFCSERCKLLDLGRWLDGDYRIPGEPVQGEQLPDGVDEPQEPADRDFG